MDTWRKEKEQESFWTACPYCDYMYEYEGLYEDCCLRCQNQKCKRAFHGVSMPKPSAAMLVQGKDQYYLFSPRTMHEGMGPNPPTKKDDQATTHVHNVAMEISSDDSGDDSYSSMEEEKGKKNKKGDKDIIDGENGMRRSNVKCVARNTKKVTGRAKETRRLLGAKPSGATSSTSKSMSHEDGSPSSDDLEFLFKGDDIYVGFKSD